MSANSLEKSIALSKTAVILNPNAAGGRSIKQLPRIVRELDQWLDHPAKILVTEYPNHATELTKQALDQGCNLIVAVGGDGTANEVVNGWFNEDDQPIHPEAQLGFIPIGTGGDLRRTLEIPNKIDLASRLISCGHSRKIDVAKVSLLSHEGRPLSRYFVNVVSFGMGGEVSVRAKNFISKMSGKLAFLYATAAVFLTYRGKRVHVTLDNDRESSLDLVVTNVAIGNGRYHGGGMQPCPQALMDDGLLEVTTIRQLTTCEFIKDLPILYSDDVYRHPKIDHYRVTKLRAESEDVTRVEVDGEALGRLPLEIEILPARLPVLGAITSG